jgi:streptogramin lyase
MFTGSGYDLAVGASGLEDGGSIVSGFTTSLGGGSDDGWLARLDSSGNVLWQNIFGGADHDYFNRVQKAAEGGFLASGQAYSFGSGNSDVWVVQIDDAGHLGATCSLEQNLALEVAVPSLTITDTHQTVTAANAPVSIATLPFYPTDGSMNTQCSQNLPQSHFVVNSRIASGDVSLPDFTGVLTSTVLNGHMVLGNGGLVQNTSVNGNLTLMGVGTVLSTNARGQISAQSGEISGCSASGLEISTGQIISNTVLAGGITAGDGSLVRGNDVQLAPAWGIQTTGVVDILRNRLVGNTKGIQSAGGLVSGNLVADSKDTGIETLGAVSVISNTLIHNAGSSLRIGVAGVSALRGNNLEFNNGSFDVEVAALASSQPTINMAGNWWGTTDATALAGRVFDFLDDYTLSRVVFEPLAGAPQEDAPAYVRSVTLDPPSPVGIQTVDFSVLFSKAMDSAYRPKLAFQPDLGDGWSTFTQATSDLVSDDVRFVTAAPNGDLWFGTLGYGVSVRYKDGTWKTYNTSNSGLVSNVSGDIAFDNQGNVWIGTDNGVSVLNSDGSWELFNSANSGLTNNAVIEIVVDAQDNKWFGTGAGVSVLGFDGSWMKYDNSNSPLPNYEIPAIAVDNQGNAWMSTTQQVWLRRANGTWEMVNSCGVYHPSFEVDSDGNAWIGTFCDLRIFKTDGSVEILNSSNSGIDGPITSIAFDVQGNAWIGIRWGGVRLRKVDGTWQVFNTSNSGIASNEVLGLDIDPQGNRWFIGLGAGVSVSWNPVQYQILADAAWNSSSTYTAAYEISSLVERGDYVISVSLGYGIDGMQIAPDLSHRFTVDYAGAISDTSAPNPPSVEACAGADPGTLTAKYSAEDPDSSITLFSYAIGTTSGGSEVVEWTNTSTTSFIRSGLNLLTGHLYYISVKARNAAGLWSLTSTPPGVAAGSATCAQTIRKIFIPAVMLGAY